MAAETITVFIDPDQLTAQKTNNYSLYLAKKVNGQFTVIWQSKNPIGTVDSPSYEYRNDFNIAVPGYQVNYTLDPITAGSVTFTASGLAQNITLNQTTTLSQLGLFSPAVNSGTAGEITIVNQLAGNPHAILLDNAGKPIFVNKLSGMDAGSSTLTPIDTYQIWFGSYQNTGTIIADNTSNVATVTFDGGTTSKTISFRHDGTWQDGSLAQGVDLSAMAGVGIEPVSITVTVIATLKYAMTVGAFAYVMTKLIGKFDNNLRPKIIKGGIGAFQLEMGFDGPQNQAILAAFGPEKFDQAVDLALKAAQQENPDLRIETWTKSDTTTVTY